MLAPEVLEYIPKEQVVLVALARLVVISQPQEVVAELVKTELQVLQQPDRAVHLQQLFHHIRVQAVQLAVQADVVVYPDQADQRVIVMVVVQQVPA